MSSTATNPLVSTKWLAEHMDRPDIRIVDASWYLPGAGRNPKDEFKQEHIPGAVFFDIDEIADTDSKLPHMLPSPEKFSSRMRKLGLGDGNHIIVYDTSGLSSAARAWWMIRAFGHEEVSVLDGGLPKWKAENRPLSDLPDMPIERHFSARLKSTMVRELDQMIRNLETQREQVLDARPPGRFEGTEPEPRVGLRGGHIPGSLNLPFTRLFGEFGMMLPPEDLKTVFENAGVDMKKPVVTTCGSGVTASVLALGLELVGHRDVAVFDGSWTEWASHEDLPAETAQEKA